MDDPPTTDSAVPQSLRDEWATDQPPPANLSGDIFLQLDPESAAGLEEMGWVNDRYNEGAWDEYEGEYIAVAWHRLLGHGTNVKELREQVVREHGVSLNRLVTTYINRKLEC